MGDMPKVAEWYIAELVMEITVEGAKSNVVHRNLTLVRARTPEEAYEKGICFGHKKENSYENPEGRMVGHRFRGISNSMPS